MTRQHGLSKLRRRTKKKRKEEEVCPVCAEFKGENRTSEQASGGLVFPGV
jgi:hypothetical protein